MSEVQSLKIGTAFLIFVVSLCGFFAPVLVYEINRRKQVGGGSVVAVAGTVVEQINFAEQPLFMIIKAFSAGIILGVAFMHLLADGQQDLADIAGYPGNIPVEFKP